MMCMCVDQGCLFSVLLSAYCVMLCMVYMSALVMCMCIEEVHVDSRPTFCLYDLVGVFISVVCGRCCYFRYSCSDEERQDEAQWICNQLDLGYNADENTAKKAVEHVLRFLGVESQEVPFIWHYRR